MPTYLFPKGQLICFILPINGLNSAFLSRFKARPARANDPSRPLASSTACALAGLITFCRPRSDAWWLARVFRASFGCLYLPSTLITLRRTGLAGLRGRTGRWSLKTCDPGGVAGRSKNVEVAVLQAKYSSLSKGRLEPGSTRCHIWPIPLDYVCLCKYVRNTI